MSNNRKTYFQSLLDDLIRRYTELVAFMQTIDHEKITLSPETISKLRDCIDQAADLLDRLQKLKSHSGETGVR